MFLLLLTQCKISVTISPGEIHPARAVWPHLKFILMWNSSGPLVLPNCNTQVPCGSTTHLGSWMTVSSFLFSSQTLQIPSTLSYYLNSKRIYGDSFSPENRRRFKGESCRSLTSHLSPVQQFHLHTLPFHLLSQCWLIHQKQIPPLV